MSRSSARILLSLLVFNGVTAVAGGINLIWGDLGSVPPVEWLQNTPFDSYVLPGILLALVVGLSSLVAAALLRYRHHAALRATVAAGLIMVGWIVGELLAIQHFSWLQVLYLVTGTAVVYLSMAGSRAAQHTRIVT